MLFDLGCLNCVGSSVFVGGWGFNSLTMSWVFAKWTWTTQDLGTIGLVFLAPLSSDSLRLFKQGEWK